MTKMFIKYGGEKCENFHIFWFLDHLWYIFVIKMLLYTLFQPDILIWSKRNNKKVIIKVSDLSKSFNNNIVLKNINFQLLEGESLAIIGASGSGKSLLLKNIIGILEPDKGSIVINDTEMVNLRRNLKEKLNDSLF